MSGTVSPDVLREVGLALYGVNWVASLTQALDVNPRRMRLWMNGSAPVPPGVAADLVAMINDRRIELDRLAQLLRG